MKAISNFFATSALKAAARRYQGGNSELF